MARILLILLFVNLEVVNHMGAASELRRISSLELLFEENIDSFLYLLLEVIDFNLHKIYALLEAII